ncbi:hypothetical protein ACS3SW_00010 [Roseobacteraceae bacterium S113]
MTDKRSEERKTLVNLADALFDDLFEMSDEDILREVADTGANSQEVANRVRAQFEEALIKSRKERLKAARAARKAAQAGKAQGKIVDISTARKALRGAFEKDGLSMAARNETESELTDEEVLRKYQDLVRLGVIGPEDGGDV